MRHWLVTAWIAAVLCAACAAPPVREPPAVAEVPREPSPAPAPVRGAPSAPVAAEPGVEEAARREPAVRELDPEALAARVRELISRGRSAQAEALARQGAAAGSVPGSVRERLARALLEGYRHEGALDVLGAPASDWGPGRWRLRGAILEALGRAAEAVEAYAAAAREADEVEAEELRARVRFLVRTMGPGQRNALTARCPACPEAGYARLVAAQKALAEGRREDAEAQLAALAEDFPDDPVGRTARAQLGDLQAVRQVRPGLYGLLLPLSGPLKPFGRRALRGALVGSRLFGDDGDPQVRLAVFDTGGDPERAARGVEELAGRGAVGIVGPLKGAAAAAAADTARRLGVPLVTLTPVEGIAGGEVYRLYLPEAEEVAVLAQYAVQERGWRRIALLYPDTAVGRRYRDLFWDEVLAAGGEVTGAEPLGAGPGAAGEAIEKLTGVFGLSREEIRRRFLEEERARLRRQRELLGALGIEEDPTPAEIEVDEQRLRTYRPRPIVDFDAVFLPVGSLEAAQIAPQFPFHDVEGVALLGIRTWNYPTLVEVGEEYVEGAVFPAETHPLLPAAREFFASYRDTFGEAPGVLEAYAHDAVRLVLGVRDGFEAETRAALTRHLAATWAAQGVTGPLTARPGGDIVPAPKLLTVRGGQILPLAE
ncbi:MAG: hypothetical protein Kow0092_13090 [Deferrisomatales bacterium]